MSDLSRNPEERRLLDQLGQGLPIGDVEPETLDQLLKEGFLYLRGGGYGVTGLGFLHTTSGVDGGLLKGI